MHRDYSDDSDDEPLAAQRIQQQQPQQKTAAPKTQAKRPSQPQAQQQQPDRATSSRRMGNEEPRPEQGTDRTSHATNGGSHHHLDEQNGQEVQPAQRGSAGEGGSSRGPNLDVNYKIKFYKMRDRYTRAQAESSILLKGLHDAQSKERKLEEELNWLLDATAARRPDLAHLKE